MRQAQTSRLCGVRHSAWPPAVWRAFYRPDPTRTRVSLAPTFAALQHLSSVTDQCAPDDRACAGTEALWRVSLGAFVTFLLLAVLAAPPLSDGGAWRARAHRGCHHLKLALLAGAAAGFLFVPGGGVREVRPALGLQGLLCEHSFMDYIVVDPHASSSVPPSVNDAPLSVCDMQVYGWTARVCGGAFLLVQIVVLLHAVYRWNDAWVGNFERYKWLLLLTSIALFGCGIALSAVSYVYYVPTSGCGVNIAAVTVSLGLSLLWTALSLSERNGGGLMTSAAFLAYTMFITWSALGSLPADEPCNTLGNEAGATWVQAISFALLFLSLIISAFNSQGASSAFVLSKADAQGGSGGDEVDEDESPGFRYSLSHVLLLLAVAYSAVTLTGWELRDSDAEQQQLVDTGYAPFWIKLASAWVGCALYGWTLLAPILMPGRDFS